MAILIIRHTVKDFPTWKSAFDQHATARKTAGCKGGELFHDQANPNDVTVVMRWDNQQNAQAFAQSPDLKAVMEKAGVTGQPQVRFLNDVGRFNA